MKEEVLKRIRTKLQEDQKKKLKNQNSKKCQQMKN